MRTFKLGAEVKIRAEGIVNEGVRVALFRHYYFQFYIEIIQIIS
jgi:hypothetical protein